MHREDQRLVLSSTANDWGQVFNSVCSTNFLKLFFLHLKEVKTVQTWLMFQWSCVLQESVIVQGKEGGVS